MFKNIEFFSTGGGVYFITGTYNKRPFLADNDGLQVYLTDEINDFSDDDEITEKQADEITDADFWESLVKHIYKTSGDEFGTIIKYLSGD